MKPKKCAVLLVPMLTMLLGAQLAWAGDDVEEQLKSEYRDKVLTLRHFYEGNHLQFQPDGSLIGSASVGPWTVDGQIAVKTIKLHGRTLQIKGRRVCLVFDAKEKPARDVLESLRESKRKDHEKIEQIFRDRKDVEIEIEFPSEKPHTQDIAPAMNAVFLAPAESLRDIVPDFWRDYFDQNMGQPPVQRSADPVYVVKRGEVSPPRTMHNPDPEFSDEARIAKYQGTMILSIVVDPSGAVRDLGIVTPLGLGLDEQAVAAVRSWRFEPGMKDGSPVAVKVAVEVDFRLY
jgi:TonB family protein